MLKTNKKPQLWFSCYEKAFVFTTGMPGKSQEFFLRCQLPVALQKVQVWERVPTCENTDVSWVLVPLTSGFFLQLSVRTVSRVWNIGSTAPGFSNDPTGILGALRPLVAFRAPSSPSPRLLTGSQRTV